jgi:hypothetical protein
MLEFTETRTIDSHDFDRFVQDIYKRPYCFQQQDGCKSRGVHSFFIPYNWVEDYDATEIEEVVNGGEMGVSFKAWLERDPKKPIYRENYETRELTEREDDFGLRLFWERNFYPDFGMIVNDLHEKGLIPEGEYMMIIDW